MKKLSLLLLAATAAAWGQVGMETDQTAGPPKQPWVALLFSDGGGNLQYVCKALQVQPVRRTFQVGDGTQTNVVVTGGTVATINITGQKLYVGARLVLSGSATSTLNGTFSVVSVTANTLVITVPTTANATYTDVVVTTASPMTSAPVWSIQILTNPGNVLTSFYFALPNGLPQGGSDTPLNASCDARATF